jgi:GNAT superfamily N-acetyltransferase
MKILPLTLDDMDVAARVHRASFDDALPWLAGLHTPEQDRWYFREKVFPACVVCGAWEAADLVGFIAHRVDWIDHLYVLPSAQGRGIGTTLLNQAKAPHSRLHLWTFQRNNRARRFYEGQGFALVRQTDGSGNDEKEPDALYLWEAGPISDRAESINS